MDSQTGAQRPSPGVAVTLGFASVAIALFLTVPAFGWLVGSLCAVCAGPAVGYFSYDPSGLRQAFKQAFPKAASWMSRSRPLLAFHVLPPAMVSLGLAITGHLPKGDSPWRAAIVIILLGIMVEMTASLFSSIIRTRLATEWADRLGLLTDDDHLCIARRWKYSGGMHKESYEAGFFEEQTKEIKQRKLVELVTTGIATPLDWKTGWQLYRDFTLVPLLAWPFWSVYVVVRHIIPAIAWLIVEGSKAAAKSSIEVGNDARTGLATFLRLIHSHERTVIAWYCLGFACLAIPAAYQLHALGLYAFNPKQNLAFTLIAASLGYPCGKLVGIELVGRRWLKTIS